MRSVEPMPGNPWPHDMVIRIDETPHHLPLLFVREAWGIARDVELPALAPAPRTDTSHLPGFADADTWTERWKDAWHRAWHWYSIEDPATAPTSEELRHFAAEDAPNPWIPPRWRAQYGDEGIDTDAFEEWVQRLQPDRTLPLEQTPERLALDALIGAWEAGVTSIVVLPFQGYWARRVTTTHFAVSAATRSDPILYDLALSTAN